MMMETLISAIIIVESGGTLDPAHAIGKDGKSFGPMQIARLDQPEGTKENA